MAGHARPVPVCHATGARGRAPGRSPRAGPRFRWHGFRRAGASLRVAEDAIPGRATSTGRCSPGCAGFFMRSRQQSFHSYLTMIYHADIGPALFLVITSLHQVPSKGKEVILMTGNPGIGECEESV